MPTMTMRLDETDAEVVRKYAEFEGKTISDFVRDAVFEKIEDQQDLATLRARPRTAHLRAGNHGSDENLHVSRVRGSKAPQNMDG